MITTIVKWGNSQGIRIPKILLDNVNLSENDTVEILTEGDNIIIKKLSPKRAYPTIQELFKNFDAEKYEKTEINWGEPVGRELW